MSIFIPVGLEKRVFVDIPKAAVLINSENASGLRYFPFCGRIITELEAVSIITGAKAELVAAGGVGGQEGCCWLAVSGTKNQISLMDENYNEVCSEKAFEL